MHRIYLEYNELLDLFYLHLISLVTEFSLLLLILCLLGKLTYFFVIPIFV
jgi:hypothetical protein